MNDEDDFRRAIDAETDDWQLLVVFSDWLREHDDPRADGFAALARNCKRPLLGTIPDLSRPELKGVWFFWARAGALISYPNGTKQLTDPESLPPDWYETVRGPDVFPEWDESVALRPLPVRRPERRGSWVRSTPC